MSIKVESVSKFYGKQKAVDQISFSASKGDVIGFLGPNGAGKSTTMKMITGYLKPDEGWVEVNGIHLVNSTLKAQREIGYLPEQNPLYKDMYVREYLFYQASIFNVSKSVVEETLKKVGLFPEANKKIKQLSKGYQQRVGLAAAILHNPSVLILDEPTTGLDPNQLQEVRKLIKELSEDKTILLSTHIMQEVEAICTRVIVINKGKIMLDRSLKELREHTHQSIFVTFDYRVEEQLIKRIPNISEYKNTHDNTWKLRVKGEVDIRSDIFDFAQENGLKILELTTENQNLESLFKELTL